LGVDRKDVSAFGGSRGFVEVRGVRAEGEARQKL
jgi:hypothetical protein